MSFRERERKLRNSAVDNKFIESSAEHCTTNSLLQSNLVATIDLIKLHLTPSNRHYLPNYLLMTSQRASVVSLAVATHFHTDK